jgi:hypothetical protein
MIVPQLEMGPGIRRLLLALMGLGVITGAAGLLCAPERVWLNYLILVFYATSVGLGAGFFLSAQYACSAGWSVAIRRIPEAITGILPIAGIGAAGLLCGIHRLYSWTDPSVIARDKTLQGKASWLNESFFTFRVAGYFIIWILLCKLIVKNSVRQDEDGDPVFTKRNVRNAVLFIILGMYTTCLASFDLLMSLQPDWYSTIFGFQVLSGVFLSGLAVITVVLIVLRRSGYKHLFKSEHLYILGCLILTFSVFWVYMWVSQHLLIWYASIPEETSYYVVRHSGGWGYVSILNVILNWLFPFLVLMPRANKLNDRVMLQASLAVLIGHWVDLYLMVMPSRFADSPPLGGWEIGLFVGSMALLSWVIFRELGKRSLVPVGDPYLVESLSMGSEDG